MKPALVLIDMQNDFLAAPGLEPSAGRVVERAAALLAACRAGGMPIVHIWTTVQRRPDNRMPHWKAADRWLCESGTPGHQPPPELLPGQAERIIQKQFFSGFGGGELAGFLGAQNCDTLYLAGVHLHACVRATALDAYARGLRVCIADDAVATDDPVHAAITRRYLAKRGIHFRSVSQIAQGSPSAGALIQRRCPAQSDRALEPVPIAAAGQIRQATAAASGAMHSWRQTSMQQRVSLLGDLAAILTEHAEELAGQICEEVGKPISMARAEVQRSCAILRAVAQEARKPLEEPSGPEARLRYQPLGVVAVITPFNNPLAIPIGKIAPAILFGNTVVWKPAPAGAGVAQKMMELAANAGWTGGDVRPLELVTGDQSTAAALAEDSNINGVTISASLGAGYALQEICARRHIPFQAEMGGNNAAIVCADADLAEAARHIAGGAFGFAGQRCTANRRAIVERACYDAFMDELQRATAALRWGDPRDERTSIGPLISRAKCDEVAALLGRAGRAGGNVIIPHENQSDFADLVQRGSYHPAAIVVGDDPHAQIVQEETFGPVLVVQRADDLQQAIALCNGVRQGLVAALFSTSSARQQEFLAEARVGVLKINRATADADATSPLGGWKASGIGPAEHGPSDREFFTRVQTIYGI